MVDGVFDAKNYTEKMLNRAAKAKLKMARAAIAAPKLEEDADEAMPLATASTSIAETKPDESIAETSVTTEGTTHAPSTSNGGEESETSERAGESGTSSNTVMDNPVLEQAEPTEQEQEQEPLILEPPEPVEPAEPVPPPVVVPDRETLLKEKKPVMARFLYLIVPVLFDVYSASVTLQVRLRSFTGILKATNFLEDGDIPMLFKVRTPSL